MRVSIALSVCAGRWRRWRDPCGGSFIPKILSSWNCRSVHWSWRGGSDEISSPWLSCSRSRQRPRRGLRPEQIRNTNQVECIGEWGGECKATGTTRIRLSQILDRGTRIMTITEAWYDDVPEVLNLETGLYEGGYRLL